MVLIINSNIVHQSKCPKDITSFYKEFPTYREYASAFLKVAKEIVGPLGLLYVFQREFGATTSSDKYVEIIGSEDATTCIIIIVQHLKSGSHEPQWKDVEIIMKETNTTRRKIKETALILLKEDTRFAESSVEMDITSLPVLRKEVENGNIMLY